MMRDIATIINKTGMVPVSIRKYGRPEPGNDYWCSYWGYGWHCDGVKPGADGLTEITGRDFSGKALCHSTMNTQDDFLLVPFTYKDGDNVCQETYTGAEWRALYETGRLRGLSENIRKSLYEGYGVNDRTYYAIQYSFKLGRNYLRKVA